MRTCRRWFILLLLLAHAGAYAARLEVVADEWCPFNCQPDTDTPGYVVEVLQAIFAPEGINYHALPWKRAMRQTQSTAATALIGITQRSAATAHLQIGQESIGYANDCLFVAPGSAVRFHGKADDLNSLNRVGIVLGYDYGQGFAEWLARPENKPKIFTASGEQPAASNLRKLMAGKLEGLIEASVVMDYLQLNAGASQSVLLAGCNQSIPMYLGFSAQYPENAALLRQFDQGLVTLRKSGALAVILAKYGLKDWQH